MKRITTFLILTLTITLSFAQTNMSLDKNGKITFKEVFEVGITANEAAKILNSYIDTSMFFQRDKNNVDIENKT